MKRIAVILLVAAGCKKDSTGVTGVDAGAGAAAPAAPQDEAQFTLTPAMLDAYLRYQRAIPSWNLPTDAGGTVDRSELHAAALTAVGLTEEQLVVIDEMVAVVVARRMVSQLTEGQNPMPDVQMMGTPLNDEQKKHMAAAAAAFKEQLQAAKDLTEERKRFGSRNIDVLLTREAEVGRAWSEAMGIGAYGNPIPTPAGLPRQR